MDGDSFLTVTKEDVTGVCLTGVCLCWSTSFASIYSKNKFNFFYLFITSLFQSCVKFLRVTKQKLRNEIMRNVTRWLRVSTDTLIAKREKKKRKKREKWRLAGRLARVASSQQSLNILLMVLHWMIQLIILYNNNK